MANETSNELPVSDPKKMKAVETANEKGKDFGPWKYKPWNGRDHWVHETTKASTFDLKKVR